MLKRWIQPYKSRTWDASQPRMISIHLSRNVPKGWNKCLDVVWSTCRMSGSTHMHEEELYEPYPPKLLPRRIFLLFHLFTQSRACNLQVQDNDDLIIAKHVFSFSLYVFWKFPSHPFFFLFLLQSYRKRHKRL